MEPAPPHGAEPHEKAEAQQRQMERKHVFVINGAAEFLEIVRIILEAERYNITTTNFVPKSFDQIVALAPDLIIMDLAFGRTTGWDLLERLHAEAVTRDIPVLLTSTDPQILERAQQQAERIGPHRSVAKPLDVDELLATVDSLIGAA